MFKFTSKNKDSKVLSHLYNRLLEGVTWFLTVENETNGFKQYSVSQINDFITTYTTGINEAFNIFIRHANRKTNPELYIRTLDTDDILMTLYDCVPELVDQTSTDRPI